MWPWQHKNVRNKLQLWLKLLLVSTTCHLIFLGWLFFAYHSDLYNIKITVDKLVSSDIPVLFIPNAKGTSVVQQAIVPKTKVNTTVIKNVSNAKTIVVKKTGCKKEQQKIKEKKLKQPKLAKQSKLAQKKEIKKNVEKNELPKKIPKKEMIKTEQKSHLASKKDVSQNINLQKTIDVQCAKPVQVSSNYREVEAMRRGQLLQKELAKHWKPPIGVAQNCECEITIMVGANGTIKDVKMLKSSGVLMYDISARQALFSMKLPQWTYGKPITVSFNQ